MAEEEKSATVTVDRVLLQICFDVAVNSMDFGSGFLDDEEVLGLRAIAAYLGVDPMLATPDNFRCKYLGKHEAYDTKGVGALTCRYCRASIPFEAWLIRCVDCNTVLGFDDVHDPKTLAPLIEHAEGLAAFAPTLLALQKDCYLSDPALVISHWRNGGGLIHCDWFAKHRGHKLVLHNEYGQDLDQCFRSTKCGSCHFFRRKRKRNRMRTTPLVRLGPTHSNPSNPF